MNNLISMHVVCVSIQERGWAIIGLGRRKNLPWPRVPCSSEATCFLVDARAISKDNQQEINMYANSRKKIRFFMVVLCEYKNTRIRTLLRDALPTRLGLSTQSSPLFVVKTLTHTQRDY